MMPMLLSPARLLVLLLALPALAQTERRYDDRGRDGGGAQSR